MNDEEIVREALMRLAATIAEDTDSGSSEAIAFARREVEPAKVALSRILSERDSLRAALEEAETIRAHQHSAYAATIVEMEAERERLRAALEAAQPYCTRYGVYLPAEEFTNGYTAHNECPPAKHVLVIARQALTSSEKEPPTLQQLQQTTSSDATLRGTEQG